MFSLVIYLVVGAAVGFFAGLLGIGGGAIIVPALAWIFAVRGFPEAHLMHLAVGTSLACILFASLSSLRAHHSHQAVNWRIFRSIVPGILIGTFAGSLLADWVSTRVLKVFFAAFMVVMATQLSFGVKARPHRELPGRAGLTAAGGVIGALSSWVGIGGGAMAVQFMTWCNVRLHEAIGTAAAIGFPIALAGSLGYFVSGYAKPDLPSYSLGYLYLPALAGITIVSVLTAPLGAKAAHALPVDKLKKVFGLFLYAVAAQMVWSL